MVIMNVIGVISMNKFIIKTLIVIFTLTIGCVKNQEATEGKVTQKKVIVCDFHGVLADTNVPQAIFPGVLALPDALYKLFGGYSIPEVKDALAVAASCQTLRQEVFVALKEAKETDACAQVYLFSGITPTSLKILRKRYPQEFKVFGSGTSDDGFIYVRPETNWIGKENLEFYKLCDAHVKSAYPDAHIIFLDNKKSNCKMGRKLGWHAIHVASAKDCVEAIKKL